MLWETVQLAQREIRRNVLRSSLTILGIVIGVAAVITLVTLGKGATVQVTEQIAKVSEDLVGPREALKPGVARTLVTKLIVELTLAIVAENFEGLGALLEALLGLRVVRVAIGVKLHRLLAIGALDLGRAGITRDSQYFVVIPFCGHRAGS